MVPFDSYDTTMSPSNITTFVELYPKKPSWWNTSFFPVIVPCPTPPVVFYYHLEWVNAQTQEERDFWELNFELEHAVLYAACWWYEASRYGRAVVLPTETIVWLKDRLQDMVIDPIGPSNSCPDGKAPVPFSYIENRMYEAEDILAEFKNKVTFKKPLDRHFTNCEFVYCEKYTGSMDGNVPRGVKLMRELNGNMYLESSHHLFW